MINGIENKNKPLDDEEVKKYKCKSIVIYSAFSFCS